ncbi:MAG: DUF58 domain-containing protein [Pseudomonadota bacterium]
MERKEGNILSAFLKKFRFLYRGKRYRVKIAPSGYVFIIITIVLGVGAVNTGNNLLYLLTSLLLALMALSGVVSLGNLFLLNFSMSPPREIFAGVPAPFELIIGKTRGHSFFLTCDTPYGSVKCPFVKGGFKTSLWLTFSKRGRGQVQTLELYSGFPMGFFKRYKSCRVGLDALVYPMPKPCPFPALSRENWSGQLSGAPFGEIGDETKGLREYWPSDPLKWIDWKATARKGEMVAREFYRLEGDTLAIDLSRKTHAWERNLSEACYLILESERKKLFVSLTLPGREIEPGKGAGHKKQLLEALALA